MTQFGVSSEACDVMQRLAKAVFDGVDNFDEVLQHGNSGCVECLKRKLKAHVHNEEWLFTDGPPIWIANKLKDAREKKQIEIEAQRREERLKDRPGTELKKPLRVIPKDMKPDDFLKQLASDPEMADGVLKMEVMAILGLDKHEAIIKVKAIRRQMAEEKRATRTQNRKAQEAVRKEKLAKEAQIKRETRRSLSKTLDENEKDETADSTIVTEITTNKMNSDAVADNDSHSDEEGKGRVKKQEMCWAPALDKIFCPNKTSLMKRADQRRYCAILNHLMANSGEARHSSNKDELKAWDTILKCERDEFYETAYDFIASRKRSVWDTYTGDGVKCVLDKWRSRYNHLIPQSSSDILYSKMPVAEVDWPKSCSEEPETKFMPHIQIVAKTHDIPEFMMPHIKSRAGSTIDRKLVADHFRDKEVDSIDDDCTIREICSREQCSIGMESSTLRMLYCDAENWESRNYSYVIPVNVTESFGFEGRAKMCMVDKPLVHDKVTNPTIWRTYHKLVLKSNFTKERRKGRKRMASTTEAPNAKKAPIETQVNSNIPTSEPDDVNKSRTGVSSLDALLDSVASSQPHISANVSQHNEKQYAVVRLGEAALPIVVRSNGGLRYNASTVTFEPKMEFVPSCGALKMSDEEWLWNFLKFQLKGSAEHLVFRVHYNENVILQTEHLLKKGKDLMQNARVQRTSLLCARTERVSSLIDELSSLDCGRYLIEVNKGQDRIRILKETHDESIPSLSLASLKNSLTHNGSMPPIRQFFVGIDMRILLTWQVVMGRAPCTFLPPDHPTVVFLRNQISAGTSSDTNNRNQRRKWNRRKGPNYHKPHNSPIKH